MGTTSAQQQEILDSIQQQNLRMAEDGNSVIIHQAHDDKVMK
jgi:hypothetical protein